MSSDSNCFIIFIFRMKNSLISGFHQFIFKCLLQKFIQWDINYLNSLLYKLWAKVNAKKTEQICLTWHKLLEAIQLLALKI
jgi:hypothetical protein